MFTPDPLAPALAWLLLGPAAAAGFWLSGHLACRALPSPRRILTDVLASLLLLFFAVLALDVASIPITRSSLLAALAVPALFGLLLARRRGLTPILLPKQAPGASRSAQWPRFLIYESWWIIPASLAAASVLARGVIDPLAGLDNVWRWNHLALVLHDTGSLAAYPPVTAGDFLVYPWCDGIPPVVSVSNLWIYLAAGSTHGGLIVARLALELILTGALVWQIARELWGPRGARFAILALSGSSLFLNSISIGQETGLSGLALLTMLALALDYQRAPAQGTAVWLGLAAAFGALCRDYNLLFLPLSLAMLLLLRARHRHVLAALAAMSLAVLPWYARNALLTGNPLFAHDLGGLLPTNPLHAFFMAETRTLFLPANTPGLARDLVGFLAIGAGGLVLLALPALLHPGRRLALLLGPLAAVTLLWWVALPSTAGGAIYATRVLGPGLPLLAILAGAWAARPTWIFVPLVAGLWLQTADAARRQWMLPYEPFAAAWPYDFSLWRQKDRIDARWARLPLWKALRSSAGKEIILVDHPLSFVIGARHGLALSPIFSPAARAFHEATPTTSRHDLISRLRADGVRFVVLSPDGMIRRAVSGQHPGLGLLLAAPPVGHHDGLVIYDLLISPPPTNASPP